MLRLSFEHIRSFNSRQQAWQMAFYLKSPLRAPLCFPCLLSSIHCELPINRPDHFKIDSLGDKNYVLRPKILLVCQCDSLLKSLSFKQRKRRNPY